MACTVCMNPEGKKVKMVSVRCLELAYGIYLPLNNSKPSRYGGLPLLFTHSGCRENYGGKYIMKAVILAHQSQRLLSSCMNVCQGT